MKIRFKRFRIPCRLRFHKPMKKVKYLFTDVVDGKKVFLWRCDCEKFYMAHGNSGFRCGYDIKKKEVIL